MRDECRGWRRVRFPVRSVGGARWPVRAGVACRGGDCQVVLGISRDCLAVGGHPRSGWGQTAGPGSTRRLHLGHGPSLGAEGGLGGAGRSSSLRGRCAGSAARRPCRRCRCVRRSGRSPVSHPACTRSPVRLVVAAMVCTITSWLVSGRPPTPATPPQPCIQLRQSFAVTIGPADPIGRSRLNSSSAKTPLTFVRIRQQHLELRRQQLHRVPQRPPHPHHDQLRHRRTN
jgi:hypothetical protein